MRDIKQTTVTVWLNDENDFAVEGRDDEQCE
jgi:hypothetical protein